MYRTWAEGVYVWSLTREMLGIMRGHAEELEPLAEQLTVLQTVRLMQVSRDWRAASLLWLGRRTAVMLGPWDGADGPLPSSQVLFPIARCCHQLQRLELDFSRSTHVDLSAVSLSCPHLEHLRLKFHPFRDEMVCQPGTLLSIACGCPRLKHLDVDGYIGEDDLVNFIEGAAQLVELCVHLRYPFGRPELRVSRAMTALARHCGTLQSLAFRGDAWTGDMLPDAMTPFPRLCELKLDIRVTDDDVRRFFDLCVNLQRFHLYSGRFLTKLPRHPNLKHLVLVKLIRATFTQSISSIMEKFPLLEHLETPGLSQRITRAPGHNMKTLVTHSCQLADADLTTVLDSCPQLENFDVSYNESITAITDSLVKTLQARGCSHLLKISGTFERLQRLDASCNERLKLIGGSFPRLERLDASTSTQLQMVYGSFPLLEKVDLSQCGKLASLPCFTPNACPRLQSLWLAGCYKLSDAAIDNVANQCPRLKHLDVYACESLTAHAIRVIDSSLQHLQTLRLTADWRHFEAVDQLCTRRVTLQADITRTHPKLLTESIILKVVSQDGEEVFFTMRLARPLSLLMKAWCRRQGVAINSIRFLFDGLRISASQCPFELEMEDGDVIDVMVEQQAVGEWVPATTLADHLLQLLNQNDGKMARIPLTTIDVALEIERVAWGPTLSCRAPRATFRQIDSFLTSAACQRLIMHAERALEHYCPTHELASSALDLKVVLTPCELASIIGHTCVDAILRLGATHLSMSDREWCGESPRLVLRRSAAAPARTNGRTGEERQIAFHRDFCRAVVNVALSDHHLGGQLVFAIDGNLHCPPRPAGSAVVHNRSAVHAVSPILSGKRYNLIAVFGDAFDRCQDGVAVWAHT